MCINVYIITVLMSQHTAWLKGYVILASYHTVLRAVSFVNIPLPGPIFLLNCGGQGMKNLLKCGAMVGINIFNVFQCSRMVKHNN